MSSAAALVLEAPRCLRPRQFALPDIGDDDGLLRIEACGLCGTDHELYTGALPTSGPMVPGHESIGTVVAVGSRAAARWGIAVGDRVAVEVFQSCRTCEQCAAGLYRRCPEHGLADTYGFIPAERDPGLWGGYAEYQYLGPDSLLVPVPTSLDPVVATLFNPLGAGIRWGATVPGTGPGHVVAVLGPGVRGLSAAAAAKEAGAAFIMVSGVLPHDAERLSIAPSFGADLVVDAAVESPAKALRRATGGGADVVIDVTAKAPAALAQAIDVAKVGGTVVLAGTRGSAETPGFWPDTIVYKELTLLGALGVDTVAYRAALDLLASGRYPFADLPRQCAGLGEAEDLLRAMAGESDKPPPVHAVVVP